MTTTDKKGATNVTMTYAESIAPPMARDYKETRRILNEFCILVTAADIPQFPRMIDLVQWRTAYIRATLA